MRQNGTVQLQDPSASPTYALSEATNNPSVPASLRRNLFASHLSRRPVPQHAGSNPETVSDPFQPQMMTSGSRWYPSQDRSAQPHSFAQLTHHDQYIGGMNSHNNYFADPRVSSSRSLSPTKNQNTTSSSGIIAIDSITGRPALPVLPTLPARFRTGDNTEEDDTDDGDPEDEEDPDMDYDHSRGAPFRRTRTFDRGVMTQHELDLHSSSMIGTSQPRLHELIDADGSTGADSTDYDKIESILSEMQSQQKARARTAAAPGFTSLPSIDTPTADSRISARTRGKSRAATHGVTAEPNGRSNNTSPSKPRVGGVGATLKSADKDELLGLIMTSLSRRVQEADEDSWIFGATHNPGADSFVGAGSFAYSREGAGTHD